MKMLILGVVLGMSMPPAPLLRGQVTNAAQGDPPEKQANAATNETTAYLLRPNDVVQIRVYQEEDLGVKDRVSSEGTITMPLLGAVPLSGKTLEQASAEIRRRLAKDFLVNPQVTVSIAEYAKRRFTILGQVQRPGTYEIPSEESLSLLQAIAMAGGYTRIGAPWKVTVRRVVAGERKILKLDADAMSKGKKANPFEILPDDNITVGERLF